MVRASARRRSVALSVIGLGRSSGLSSDHDGIWRSVTGGLLGASSGCTEVGLHGGGAARRFGLTEVRVRCSRGYGASVALSPDRR
ncbi:hypothetical protein CTKZ_26110 [Cellulomonas algicola]|uniref:Uncharacterized protein n=1 Tax=Cellulomonas algicola TaxID=2071633 RepID=A0A401V2C1_9CELL|nr:hypothetical protein CTKZ_26110 [Cellulomonas algicola]